MCGFVITVNTTNTLTPMLIRITQTVDSFSATLVGWCQRSIQKCWNTERKSICPIWKPTNISCSKKSKHHLVESIYFRKKNNLIISQFLLWSNLSHYKLLYTIFALILPTSIPVLAWNEDPIVALFVCFFARAVISLNCTWLVNSAAHLYGTRPFDKTLFPVENLVVAFFAVGEGW